MKIATELAGEVAILNLIGELDSRGNQHLDQAIKDSIARGHFKIVLDVQSIRFIGSQTISMLISNLKEIRAAGGNIKIIKPQRAVLQYLKQNRIVEIFDIYSSKAEAVQAFETGKSAAPAGAAANAESQSAAGDASESEDSSTPLADINLLKARFETGEILYANSCMLATMIKILEKKGVLTSTEAGELMDYERLSMKGVKE
ncbi:MAG: STAS domain-containing protein [Candidatus Omnitrophota bacterium]